MLYQIAHFLRDKLPVIWDVVEWINGIFFSAIYGRRRGSVIARISNEKIMADTDKKEYAIVPISDIPTSALVNFFASQPEEAFLYFKPHGFDAHTIKMLQRNKSFLGFVLVDDNSIAGYCFLRSYFFGKSFRGRMVGIDYRGKGLGTMMNKVMNGVGFSLGLKIYETVSKKNVASLRSAMSASECKIMREMDNGDLFLEIIKSR